MHAVPVIEDDQRAEHAGDDGHVPHDREQGEDRQYPASTGTLDGTVTVHSGTTRAATITAGLAGLTANETPHTISVFADGRRPCRWRRRWR